ncbi:DUF4430 domain-containing protein [Collinsella aerofaciens]|uniref:DUF4430 domain-containing protein n=1 Tax=Collinsella aerofaciens TaxID=74426 RepID=UPI00232C0DE6|nr:DUF4430 domain-containing protein [Collinsella aerofaciens]MDB1907525.1 DUF4430 domain-containing protein [Collinsella aerofaciens]MDB1909490.1 DUF4430 domain-containing protein [Collinsella aerofaciens]MDB1911371.1 DUF4430 domain-containing protein [Collinsella aerofaciens]
MSNKSKDADPKQPDSSFIQFDDAKQQGAALAASAPRRKALTGVLTAACVALIVISLGFVHPSESGAWSIDWIVQTVTGESVVAKDAKGSDSTVASGKAGSKDSKSSDGANDESKGSDKSDSKKESESSDKESNKGSDSKKSEDQDGKKSGDKSAAQNTGAGDTSNVSGGASSGGGQSSNGASSSNGGNASSGGQSGSQESNYVTVTVSVTSSSVGNPVSSGGTFTFNEGATVYDALCALGLSVNAHGSSYGTYVSAIGGLAEKQYGGTSGWMYSVNGTTPMTACSNYVLSNGDNVVWYYVTG